MSEEESSSAVESIQQGNSQVAESQVAESPPSNFGDLVGDKKNEPSEAAATEVAQDRPDFLLEKYKTVEDQAKAYVELQKMAGRANDLQAIAGAPDAYEIPESLKNNPVIGEVAELFKQSGLNQEFLNKTLEIAGRHEDAQKANVADEITKLGDNGKERVDTVRQWLVNNSTQEQLLALRDVPMTAETIKLFEGFKKMTIQSGVPTNTSANTSTAESINDLRAEMKQNHGKIRADPIYAAELNQRFIKAGSKVIGKPE
jgi:hypothetical protein